MKTRKTRLAAAALAAALTMTGCVSTLFFPAKSAEKAANKVIDDIWPAAAKPELAKSDAKKS